MGTSAASARRRKSSSSPIQPPIRVGVVDRVGRAHRHDQVVVGRLTEVGPAGGVADFLRDHRIDELEAVVSEPLADQHRLGTGFVNDDERSHRGECTTGAECRSFGSKRSIPGDYRARRGPRTRSSHRPSAPAGGCRRRVGQRRSPRVPTSTTAKRRFPTRTSPTCATPASSGCAFRSGSAGSAPTSRRTRWWPRSSVATADRRR